MTTPYRYVFTAVAGRSGQNAFCELLRRHVPDCYAAFEEPNVRPLLPGRLATYERRFRRRFIETHELLGRGRVLSAYAAGDETYLDHIATRRLALIERTLRRTGNTIHVDVSKFYARGLHRAFLRARPDAGLIRMLRDPIANMRSFLNRDKQFTLDNNLPDAAGNILRLDSTEMSKGELYLWAWCEIYLRFEQLVDEFDVQHHVTIRTEHLNDPARMTAHLDTLGLPHDELRPAPRVNTNLSQGHGETRVYAEDRATFDRFWDRLSPAMRARLSYFDDYDPAAGAAESIPQQAI